MKFKGINKHFVHVSATPWDAITHGGIHIPDSCRSSVMIGTILRQSEGDIDKEMDALLTPGTQILFSVIDRDNNPLVEPLDKQAMLDPGEYLVYKAAILGIAEFEDCVATP